jgi:hypothetical protein
MGGEHDKLRINPAVTSTAMPDGAVLVDSETGECFELNRVGASVWERLKRGDALTSIIDALAVEYTRDRALVSGDVTSLVQDLARHGIVTPAR